MRRSWYASLIFVLLFSLIVSGCGSSSTETTSKTENPPGQGETPKEEKKPLKVGYVVNFGSHEWYQNILKGAEETAKEKGIDFKWADANTDLAKQITQAENLLTQGVDVLVLSPVDPAGLSSVLDLAKQKGVPVFSESTSIPGALTRVGISDYEGGVLAGEYAGKYIKENFKEKAKVLNVGLPALEPTRDRVAGFVEGLKKSGADFEVVQEVDGKGLKDQALKVATDAITAHKDINVIFGINDDSALGGLQAYQEAGLDMNKLLVIGFGVEGVAGKKALTSNGPYKAGLGMFPEYVGRKLIETAEKVHAGEKVEPDTITPIQVLTPENLSQYYTQDGNAWNIKFEDVAALKSN